MLSYLAVLPDKNHGQWGRTVNPLAFMSVERISENGINLVRVTVNPHAPAPNTSDWDRVKSMTEEELQAAIDSDPDCAELPDEAWETAEFVPAFTPIQHLKR